MPLYHKTLTVPKNTPEMNPAQVDIEIHQRIVIYASVKFPRGCHDLVHVALFYGIKQLMPYLSEESVVGDGETVWGLEWWEAPGVPWKLTVKGWSPGTAFNHSPVVRVVTLPDITSSAIELIFRVSGRLELAIRRIFGV